MSSTNRKTTDMEQLSGIFNAFTNMKGTFSCGGFVELCDPIKLYYCAAAIDKTANVIEFPTSDEADFQQLLNACSPASFGRGAEAVIDPSYRNALKLDSQRFATTFNVASTSMLDEIRRVMAPDSTGIQAEMYAFNIYGPGGHFKTHIDTPRSPLMFGSLVVALPCEFTGGALIVNHDFKITKFCWGKDEDPNTVKATALPRSDSIMSIDTDNGTDSDSVLRLHWAAFYSDCEHEIEEVRSGYRVTLTYNLLYGQSNVLEHSLNMTATPLFKEFCKALDSASFFPNGGTIGVHCKHKYAHTSRGANVFNQLKGIDMVFTSIAHALGLEVKVKPYYEITDCTEGTWIGYIGENFQEVATLGECSDDYPDPIDSASELNLRPAPMIYWLTSHKKNVELAGVGPSYGNEPSVHVIYSSAVILVTVDSYEERQK